MLKGRLPRVVDTNVPIVANRREGGSYACARNCAQELLSLRQEGVVVLDSGGLILAQYRTYLNFRGQPGAGDAFFKWFFNNRGKADLCKEITVTPALHAWRRFEEFPEDADLSDFDKSDQVFVATARAHGPDTTIIQASDHKWLKWSASLRKHDVHVKFLCEEELRATARRKQTTALERDSSERL